MGCQRANPTCQPNLPNAGDIWTGPPWLDYVYGCFMAPPRDALPKKTCDTLTHISKSRQPIETKSTQWIGGDSGWTFLAPQGSVSHLSTREGLLSMSRWRLIVRSTAVDAGFNGGLTG